MTIDLRLAQNWEDQSRFVKEILGVSDSNTQVGLYHGVGHAILDTLYGMKEFWPLKKSLIVVSDGDPYLLSCLKTFVRESYDIKQVSSNEIGNTTEWVNGLKADVLAVIYSGDHAFSGELLLPQELSERLSAKKIYSIEIQHSLHAYSKRLVFPWHVQVQHFFPDLAVVLQGSRIRKFQHTANLLDWSHRNLDQEFKAWYAVHKENENVVKKFEAHFGNNKWGVATYFDAKFDNRLWDRSLIFVKNIGGDHLINRLAERLNIKLPKPGFSDLLETTHFCRWNVASEFNWWGIRVSTLEEFQSLIAISTNILEKDDFFNSFIQVLSACHQETELL
jgi:hypothetical protein